MAPATATKKAPKKKSATKKSATKKAAPKRDTAAASVPRRWKKYMKLIPGYAPVATAGPCRFDPDAADMAVEFFPECLVHIEGPKAGGEGVPPEPFELEPFQIAIVGNLFGWKRPDGSRRYRVLFLYIPRKNGKSTLGAGIALETLFLDHEPGAEIYGAGGDKEQARVIFDLAQKMVLADSDLHARATVYQNAIVLSDGSGSYKPISSYGKTKHGFNVHAAFIDELHTQRTRDLVDALTTGMGARRQPLTVYMTTADFDRPSICNETHEYATKIRDGVIENRAFLPVIFETDKDEDWTDRKVWKKANPNLGVSTSWEDFEEQFDKAQEIPSFENTFKRLKLNIKTEQATRWLRLAAWDACGKIVIPDEELKAATWYAGLDLSATTDVAAFVLYTPGLEAVLPFFWIPEESAYLREKRDKVPYRTWVSQGFMRQTEGNVVDFDVIRRDINVLADAYKIERLAVDRWESTQIQNQLTADGFDVDPFGQGFASMNAPAKEIEKLVMSQALRHMAHPVLRWMASNVCTEEDAAGNIKPSKKRSSEKIDGIVGLVMAKGAQMEEAPKPKESRYKKKGLRVV